MIEKLKKEIELWSGYNRHIVSARRAELRELLAKEKKPEVKKEKKLSEKYYFALSKQEQIDLLEEAGITKKDIPRFEKDRVKLLLKLHK